MIWRIALPGCMLSMAVALFASPSSIVSLAEWATWVLGVTLLGCWLVDSLELVELLTRRRRSSAASVQSAAMQPFVSLHVPICSEPPDVVAKTLLALSDLRYAAYEVIVVDNNTEDERLWRPISHLCRDLGPHFRFYHLPCWPGFKAGALNFALRQSSPEATVIGVVDSDYIVDCDYLADLVSYFGDSRIGFVQTPQNYRDWHTECFGRMCYWEYWQFFAVGMMVRNEYNAILMHGTMNLVRKRALLDVGEWAEWCLTEDSELGLRILSAHYHSVYVPRTYGRGLVPFSYDAFRRQRRRWVMGGAQILVWHWRLFLPWGGVSRGLSTAQKLRYLQGWMHWIGAAAIVLAMPMAVALSLAALVGLARVETLACLSVGIVSTFLYVIARATLVYRFHLLRSWRETMGTTLMICGLVSTIGRAWLAGLLPVVRPFHRTPKEPLVTAGWITEVRLELLVGASLLLLGSADVVWFGPAGLAAAAGLWTCAALLLATVWTAYVAADEAGSGAAVAARVPRAMLPAAGLDKDARAAVTGGRRQQRRDCTD